MKRLMIALLLCLPGSAALAADLPEFPFVFVQGKAETNVPPDNVKITFRVEHFSEAPADALSVVRERSGQLVALIEKHRIAKKDFVAYDINKRARREKKEYQELKILGYEVSRRFTITLRDLQLYGTIMKELLTLENVVNTDSKFDTSDRKTIEAELMDKACENARAQAALMAKGFKAELGPVFALSRIGFHDLNWKFITPYGVGGLLAESAASETEFLFVPSTITLENQVSVIFKLRTEE
jgi:uncharacterized protein YggE